MPRGFWKSRCKKDVFPIQYKFLKALNWRRSLSNSDVEHVSREMTEDSAGGRGGSAQSRARISSNRRSLRQLLRCFRFIPRSWPQQAMLRKAREDISSIRVKLMM
jgi:hypothetical protein